MERQQQSILTIREQSMLKAEIKYQVILIQLININNYNNAPIILTAVVSIKNKIIYCHIYVLILTKTNKLVMYKNDLATPSPQLVHIL